MTQVIINSMDDMDEVFVGIQNAFDEADYDQYLSGVIERLGQIHGQYFQAETDPNGVPWPPLADSTVERKGHNEILLDTGRLKESLTGESPDSVRRITHEPRNHVLEFGTSVEYSIFHQEPDRLPERKHVGISGEVLDVIVNEIADETVKALKANP